MEDGLLSEGTFAKQRRNLFVTSVLLLVYYLGGGGFEAGKPAELSTPAGKFFLANPSILLVFLWVAFFYFVWRYWLYAREHHKEVSDRYVELLKMDEQLAKTVRRQFDTYEGHPINVPLMSPGVDQRAIVCVPNLIKYKPVGPFSYEITTPFQITMQDGILAGIPPGTELTKRVSLFPLAWHFFRNFIRAAAEKSAFSDLIGPYLVAGFTIAACGGTALADLLVYFGH
jgi:hypothetical protein